MLTFDTLAAFGHASSLKHNAAGHFAPRRRSHRRCKSALVSYDACSSVAAALCTSFPSCKLGDRFGDTCMAACLNIARHESFSQVGASRSRLTLQVRCMSRFSDVAQAPPDPILGVSEAFRASTSPTKLNLGVGAYRDEDLKPVVLSVVKKVNGTRTLHV